MPILPPFRWPTVLLSVAVCALSLCGLAQKAGASDRLFRVRFDGATSSYRADGVPGRLAPVLERVATRLEFLRASWTERGLHFSPVLPERSTLSRLPSRQAAAPALARVAEWITLRVPSSTPPRAVNDFMRAYPDAEIVEEPVAYIVGSTPADPFLVNQTPMLSQIGAFDAWDSTRAAEGEVIVAIVDGGTEWTHPDLMANLWHNPAEVAGNSIDDDGNGFVDDVVGWNFQAGVADPRGSISTPANALHGTHVAGTVGAVTNNGIGVAGIAWNPRVMLLNVADPVVDGAIRYGYDGILYAALNGADVINCSWRTAGSRGGQVVSAQYNPFHHAVLEFAEAMGAVVVGAVGNDYARNVVIFPAAYPTVLSVGATRFERDEAWPWSNEAAWVDLGAPGERMLSTVPVASPSPGFGPYDFLTGTSMATAVVSGAAALLRTAHPGWTPLQVRHRLRETTRPFEDGRIDSGTGMLRMDRALAAIPSTGLVTSSVRLVGEDGDGLVEAGEVQDIAYQLESIFDHDGPALIEMMLDDPWVVALVDRQRLLRVRPGAPLDVRRGLKLWVHPNAPAQHELTLRLRASTDQIQGRWQSFRVQLVPLRATVSSPAVQMEASYNGRLGQVVTRSTLVESGLGFRWSDERVGPLGLGSFLVGMGEDAVSDALGPLVGQFDDFDDFSGVQGSAIERDVFAAGEERLILRYSDRTAENRIGLNVEQVLWTRNSPGAENVVFSEWKVRGNEAALDAVRVGLALDWNGLVFDALGIPRAVDERLRFDPAEDAHWTVVEAAAGEPRLGGAVILEAPASARTTWVPVFEEVEGRSPLYDRDDLASDVSDSLLWSLLTSSGEAVDSPAADVCAVVASDPFSLAVGDTIHFAVAFCLGRDEAELQRGFAFAREEYERHRWSEGRGESAFAMRIDGLNPFQGIVTFELVVPRPRSVRVEVFDARGRRVARLLDASLPAGLHALSWDGRDDGNQSVADGVYFVRARSEDGTVVRRITRLR